MFIKECKMSSINSLVPDCMINLGDNNYKCSKYGFVLKNPKLPILCSKCNKEKPVVVSLPSNAHPSGYITIQQAPPDSGLWTPQQQSRGFGDTIAKVTDFFGIKPCGGCKKRQEFLNRVFPYAQNQDNPEMKSPQNQWCIQLEVTNFCPKKCSNCTRHCPHIKKPYFMDLDTFTRAVKSMDGYEGMLGIQGGEPTLHPQFEELIQIYDELWTPEKEILMAGRKPIIDFGDYHAKNLMDNNHRRGLWSALGPGYYKHFELIQETFPYQCLNDHNNPARHTPMLITRKELGIPDMNWVRYRNNCWIQHNWSSSITPKGAFPCEIMASLDMLYDGPGGWDIEPGWWKREFKDFGKMLELCELCGACLPLEDREAQEQIQDISRKHLAMLTQVESPAIEQNKYEIYDLNNLKENVHRDNDWYMPEEYKTRRVNQNNNSTKPKFLEGIIVSVGCASSLKMVLSHNSQFFDTLVVVTTSGDLETQELVKQTSAKLLISDVCYEGDVFNKAKMINEALKILEMKDWILFLDADIWLPNDFRNKLFNYTLNPGCLYYTRRRPITNINEFSNGEQPQLMEIREDSVAIGAYGFFQLWNVKAKSVREIKPFKYPEVFCSAGGLDLWFRGLFPKSKTIFLDEESDQFDTGHIEHGCLAGRWNGFQSSNNKWKYIGQSNFRYSIVDIKKRWNIPDYGFIRIVNVFTGKSGIIPMDNFIGNIYIRSSYIFEYHYKETITDEEQKLLTTWNEYFADHPKYQKQLKYLELVVVSVNCSNMLEFTLPKNIRHFDKYVVVTTPDDIKSQQIAKQYGAYVVISDSCYKDGQSFNKSNMINVGLDNLEMRDWVVFTDADIVFPNSFRESFDNIVLDKDNLYYTRRTDLIVDGLSTAQRSWSHYKPWGYFQLWNVNSKYLNPNIRLPDCFCSAGNFDAWFYKQFPVENRVGLPDDKRFSLLHIAHNHLEHRWNGVIPREAAGWRFVGQTAFYWDKGLPNFNKYLRKNITSGFLKVLNIFTLKYGILPYDEIQNISIPEELVNEEADIVYEYQYKQNLLEEEKQYIMTWKEFMSGE